MFILLTFLLLTGHDLCPAQSVGDDVVPIDLFSKEHIGKPEMEQLDQGFALSNHVLRVHWEMAEGSVVLSQIENKYDGSILQMQHVTLFAFELSDGRILTNRDLKLDGEMTMAKVQVTDLLPTRSLRFPGVEVSGRFHDAARTLSVVWTARLRVGSNYVRQQIELTALEGPQSIAKVIFLDGQLPGAKSAGSVLGSPIELGNVFFGMEHPIAQSKALYSRTLGSITRESIDITDVIDVAGTYTLAVEHGGGPSDYNISRVALLDGDKVIDVAEHALNGKGGNNFYDLTIDTYNPKSRYRIKPELVNRSKATGTFHIFKKTPDVLNFYVVREDELKVGGSISEWAVIGVAPQAEKRRAFLHYLERERARPYKQFLHYNCWWDITNDGASSFTSEQLIERMHAWNKKFIEPFGLQLDAFVFDDGWDDLDKVWYFDPEKFPHGFAPQKELCEAYNSGIGVWMSPFGGYLANKRRRVISAKREGLETNGKGLSLAGPNYYNRFLERSLDMLNNYKVNYFKYDGFGGSEPKYLPDMEAGTRLIKTLRKHNPDVYVNITVGSWPSPFWLKYADCTWRGSGDLHNAGVGSKTQKFMTYRDGTLHNNIVKRAPYYPLNSIMVCGIAYANLGHPANYISDNKDDFADMVWSFFGAGSSLQELYISHDRMKPEFWPILANAVRWSQANEHIFSDVHWVGGSPINLEVYGFAAWKPEKGIITLRNPSGQKETFKLDLKAMFELPETHSRKYVLKQVLRPNADPVECHSDRPTELTLAPFELVILEALPAE